MEGYTLTLYLGFAAGMRLLRWGFCGAKGLGMDAPVRPPCADGRGAGRLLYHMLFEAKSPVPDDLPAMMAPLAAWGLAWRPKGVKASPAP